jgi:hypothetical protein
MNKTIKPWTAAIMDALVDSKRSVDRETLLAVGAAAVPSREAVRVVSAKRERDHGVATVPKPGTKAYKVWVAQAQRYVASQALLSLVRHGRAVRSGDRFTATTGLRSTVRAARKSGAKAA